MSGEEEIGRLFEYRVELLRRTKDGQVSPDDLLGKNVTVELKDVNDAPRYFNGWVSHFEQLGETDGRYDVYRVDLRPWLWYLRLSANCRIFQHKTAVEILQDVCGQYKTKQIEDNRLTSTYRKRAFCVQYRESDFDFVSRLMEDEGIYYHFEHSKGRHVMVLGEGSSAHRALRGGSLGWAAGQADGHLSQDVITRWRRLRSVRSLKYTHTDYDPETPTSDLTASASRKGGFDAPSDLEVFDYPGEYDDLEQSGNTTAKKQAGERLAKLRIQAYEAHHDVIDAVTRCRGVAAGLSFSFKDHADKGEYLITRNDFEFRFGAFEGQEDSGHRLGFESRLDLVPKGVRYLPFAVTARPVISGPQTATVVGPSGDELHTDKHSRVKVQFLWDRAGKNDQDSSCWVRVSQPWASKQFGFINLPRIGDEVVVEFLEGNPDRPIITGRVYNGTHAPPFTLPEHATVTGIRTRSSKDGGADTYSELRFEDEKGKEYVRLQSERDFHRLVKNDAFDSVNNDCWADVGKNDSRKVGENYTLNIGKASTVSVGADTNVTLGADGAFDIAGQAGIQVGQALALKVGEAATVSTGTGVDLKVGAGLKINATSSVAITGTAGVVIDGVTQLTIKAGGAFITLGPDGVSITGTLVKINSGGSAGSAPSAQSAQPAKPTKPADPKKNEDPLKS
jgi:type VI secretion system secreted protein VgrG